MFKQYFFIVFLLLVIFSFCCILNISHKEERSGERGRGRVKGGREEEAFHDGGVPGWWGEKERSGGGGLGGRRSGGERSPQRRVRSEATNSICLKEKGDKYASVSCLCITLARTRAATDMSGHIMSLTVRTVLYVATPTKFRSNVVNHDSASESVRRLWHGSPQPSGSANIIRCLWSFTLLDEHAV